MFHHVFGADVLPAHVVDEDHHLADSSVECKALDIFGHFLDGLVQDAQRGFVGLGFFDAVQYITCFDVNYHTPCTLQKAVDAFDAVHRPRLGGFQRPHEHFVQTHRIGPVLFDDIVGIDDVAAGLTHFLVVRTEYHALVDEFLVGLLCRDIAQVEQQFMPESRIQEVQHRVLSAADVQIDRQPDFLLLKIYRGSIILWIHIPQIIPAASCPLRHSVGFTSGFRAIR